MDIKDEVEALRQQVVALQDQMQIVLLMLSQPAPEPAPEPPPQPESVQEAEPQIINFKDINFPI